VVGEPGLHNNTPENAKIPKSPLTSPPEMRPWCDPSIDVHEQLGWSKGSLGRKNTDLCECQCKSDSCGRLPFHGSQRIGTRFCPTWWARSIKHSLVRTRGGWQCQRVMHFAFLHTDTISADFLAQSSLESCSEECTGSQSRGT